MTKYSGLAQRIIVPMAVLALSAGLASAARAEAFSEQVMMQCARTVGQMKFEGWPAERSHSMMMLACQTAGGHIPGAREESTVALPRRRVRA